MQDLCITAKNIFKYGAIIVHLGVGKNSIKQN